MVILRMPGCNDLAIGLVSGLTEKFVACVSPGFFDPDLEFFAHAGDVGSAGHDWDSERFAEVSTSLKFLVGFFPHAVMEMCGDYIVLEGLEEVQQGS